MRSTYVATAKAKEMGKLGTCTASDQVHCPNQPLDTGRRIATVMSLGQYGLARNSARSGMAQDRLDKPLAPDHGKEKGFWKRESVPEGFDKYRAARPFGHS